MIDALWTGEFVASKKPISGGVVVLKSGHILGGDTSFFYLGRLNSHGNNLSGDFRITRYTGHGPTAWGDAAAVVDATIAGTQVSDTTISGKVSREGHPDLVFRMTRRAALPQ
jgi:hypothetical protein